MTDMLKLNPEQLFYIETYLTHDQNSTGPQLYTEN